MNYWQSRVLFNLTYVNSLILWISWKLNSLKNDFVPAFRDFMIRITAYVLIFQGYKYIYLHFWFWFVSDWTFNLRQLLFFCFPLFPLFGPAVDYNHFHLLQHTNQPASILINIFVLIEQMPLNQSLFSFSSLSISFPTLLVLPISWNVCNFPTSKTLCLNDNVCECLFSVAQWNLYYNHIDNHVLHFF